MDEKGHKCWDEEDAYLCIANSIDESLKGNDHSTLSYRGGKEAARARSVVLAWPSCLNDKGPRCTGSSCPLEVTWWKWPPPNTDSNTGNHVNLQWLSLGWIWRYDALLYRQRPRLFAVCVSAFLLKNVLLSCFLTLRGPTVNWERESVWCICERLKVGYGGVAGSYCGNKNRGET